MKTGVDRRRSTQWDLNGSMNKGMAKQRGRKRMIIGGKTLRMIAVRIKDRTVGLKGKSGAGPQARLSMSIQRWSDIGVEA